MPKLPVIKPKPLLKTLERAGFVVVRQKGSHVRLHHPDGRKVTIAFHNRPLKRGTFMSVLKQANLTVDDFLKLLK